MQHWILLANPRQSFCSLQPQRFEHLQNSGIVERKLLSTCLDVLIFKRPKKIQTPHSLFRDFGAHKTFTLVGQVAEFKFESKFKPLLCREWLLDELQGLHIIWQSLPKAFNKSSCTVWAGLTDKHKHRAFSSHTSIYWQRQAGTVTGSLEKKVLPLLQYQFSFKSQKGLMLWNLCPGLWRLCFFPHVNWNVWWDSRDFQVFTDKLESKAHHFAWPFQTATMYAQRPLQFTNYFFLVHLCIPQGSCTTAKWRSGAPWSGLVLEHSLQLTRATDSPSLGRRRRARLGRGTTAAA